MGVLEKTLESPLDCKEIQPVHSEGDQPWDFFGGNDAKAETPMVWPPDSKDWVIGNDPDSGKDWGQEENGTTEDEMVGWHHQLDGHGFGWTLEVGDGQGGLVFCGSWGRKESDMTEGLNWNEPMHWKVNSPLLSLQGSPWANISKEIKNLLPDFSPLETQDEMGRLKTVVMP